MAVTKHQASPGSQHNLSRSFLDRTKTFLGGSRGWGGAAGSTLAFGASFIPDILLRQEGEGISDAVARGGMFSLAHSIAPRAFLPAAIGTAVAGPIVSAAADSYHRQESRWNQYFRPNIGGDYQDTEAALTMRSAAVQAIQQSKMNTRSALGTEGSMMHRRMR